MRSSTDALRSLKKYVAQGLLVGTGYRWEVRLAWEEGTFKRPFCRVGFAGPEQSTGNAYLRDIVRPFNVLCHPPEAYAADEALIQSTTIGRALSDLFEQGVGWTEPEDPLEPQSTPVAIQGYGLRVPLWDFDGVPANETTTKRTAHDFMRVSSLSVNDVGDPIDELRRAVACDVRLGWRRVGQADVGGATLRGSRVRSEAP